jgi:phosphoribosylanthranilate isomerase
LTERPVQVKVCGLTEVHHAVACVEAGVDWIGLNFHPASPRSISLQRGAEIVGALRSFGRGTPVGLFVDRPFREVAEVILAIGSIDTIQLHGDEPPEYLVESSSFDPKLRVVRAFRLSDVSSVDAMAAYLDRAERLGCPPYAILVDAHVAGQAGGTGQSVPFAILDQLPHHPRLILAGGLTPENVAERVALARPWMVDVASGVESAPGIKDLVKVVAFVGAARHASGHVRREKLGNHLTRPYASD